MVYIGNVRNGVGLLWKSQIRGADHDVASPQGTLFFQNLSLSANHRARTDVILGKKSKIHLYFLKVVQCAIFSAHTFQKDATLIYSK